MSEQDKQKPSWKNRIYIMGALLGAVTGFLSAYLFAQEAEEAAENKEERPKVPATTLLSLALSALGLVRQIAETGKKKKDGKK